MSLLNVRHTVTFDFIHIVCRGMNKDANCILKRTLLCQVWLPYTLARVRSRFLTVHVFACSALSSREPEVEMQETEHLHFRHTKYCTVGTSSQMLEVNFAYR
jgi:hypothetical protein